LVVPAVAPVGLVSIGVVPVVVVPVGVVVVVPVGDVGVVLVGVVVVGVVLVGVVVVGVVVVGVVMVGVVVVGVVLVGVVVVVVVVVVAGETVHVNVVWPAAPDVSVAVTVTVADPEAVGVPVIRPLELIDSPAGRPVAEKVGLPPPESVAASCNDTPEPTDADCEPGFVTVTVGGETAHVNDACPLLPHASVAVTVTVPVPAAVGAPVISPFEPIRSPAGRPLAVKVRASLPESFPATCKFTATPIVEDWDPGLVTVIVFGPG
jgi:hypothetical protein